jgi:hypothetical protein
VNFCAVCEERLTVWEARALAADAGRPLCVPCVRSTDRRQRELDRKRRELDRLGRECEWLSVVEPKETPRALPADGSGSAREHGRPSGRHGRPREMRELVSRATQGREGDRG